MFDRQKGHNLTFVHFSASTFMAPYLHLFSAAMLGAFWDEFSEQHQHQSIKSTICSAQLAPFWGQIRCRFNQHFSLGSSFFFRIKIFYTWQWTLISVFIQVDFIKTSFTFRYQCSVLNESITDNILSIILFNFERIIYCSR